MERKIWITLKRKRKQTKIKWIRKSPTYDIIYGIQKLKQSKCIFIMQSRDLISNKKSKIIWKRILKNKRSVRIINKISINDPIGSSQLIKKIIRIMDIKSKKDWRIERIRDVLNCSRPWKSTEINQIIIRKKTITISWVNASKDEGSSSIKW